MYYAARTQLTAIAETRFHRERFLRYTQEPDCEITLRVYRGQIKKALHDIRPKPYTALHHPDDYALAQQFAQAMRGQGSWGLVYRSVRDSGGRV